jgi:hypothetical protein
MKRERKCLAVACVLLLLVLAGCSNPGGSSNYEFVGTWQMSASGSVGTFVITPTSLSATATGLITGTLSATISGIDTASKHFIFTQTAATGIYLLSANGTVYYATYNVIGGNALYLNSLTSGYPTTATSGPYLKQ